MCSNLESLDLTKCRGVVDGELVARLARHCTGLTALCFTNNCYVHLQTVSYKTLGQGCTSLTDINFSDSYGVTEAALRALTDGCPGLSAVNLANTRVGDAAVICLAQRCHYLTLLDVSNCAISITDAAVAVLARSCPHLNTLKATNSWRNASAEHVTALARGCPLTHLDLGACGVDDTAVCVLALDCRSLTYLSLTWCFDISDAAVLALIQHCPSLTTLCLGYTAVTDVSVLAIADGGLPNLCRLDITKDDDDDDDEEAAPSVSY